MSLLSHDASAESSSLDRYLHEIGGYPLISREDEALLARRIREGDTEALHTLVIANLRFVVAMAKKYQNRGVSLPDLINEGNVGLMRAARKFDETRGIKFISYAVWWIRQAIVQALQQQGRTVSVPASRTAAANRVGRRAAALAQTLGREPTLREIADDLQESEEELGQALAVSKRCLSLDAPAVTGEKGRLLDTLVDSDSPLPDDHVFDEAVRQAVADALASLTPREALIVRLYYGLGDEGPMTLEAIGERMGVTRERVRQIRERVLLRLRQRTRLQPLRPSKR